MDEGLQQQYFCSDTEENAYGIKKSSHDAERRRKNLKDNVGGTGEYGQSSNDVNGGLCFSDNSSEEENAAWA